MDEKRYKVVFNGRVAADTDTTTVKRSLAALMQAETRQIEMLFSGQTIVIKKNLSSAQAHKYVDAFRRVGALAVVRPQEAANNARHQADRPAFSDPSVATHSAHLSSAVTALQRPEPAPANRTPVSSAGSAPADVSSVELAELDDSVDSPWLGGLLFCIKAILTLLFSGAVCALIAYGLLWSLSILDFAGLN